MAQKVADLIGDREPPVTVHFNDPVRKAVKLMFENGYNQLPVVDDSGHVMGLFTERALIQAVYMDTIADIQGTAVQHYMERHGEVVGLGRSIFHAARLLGHQHAVVVGHESKPVAVLTAHDIAVYLGAWSEAFALVEDVEQRLRAYSERVFWTSNMLDAALYKAFGPSHDHEGRPAKEYGDLTLSDHVLLILAKGNWPEFEPYLKPRPVFEKLLSQVRPIRNQITHFRGQLAPSQLEILRTARDWLARCPRVPERYRSAMPGGGPTV